MGGCGALNPKGSERLRNLKPVRNPKPYEAPEKMGWCETLKRRGWCETLNPKGVGVCETLNLKRSGWLRNPKP